MQWSHNLLKPRTRTIQNPTYLKQTKMTTTLPFTKSFPLSFYKDFISPLANFIASRPVLMKNQNIVLYWYGVWMATAYCASLVVALYYLSLFHSESVRDYATVLFFFMFPSAIIGARLFSWVLEDKCDPCQILRPGFWWHGGLFGVLVGTFVGCKLANDALPVLAVLDSFGLATPAFEIFNRVGCLSYGCCWGRVVPPGKETAHGIRFCNPNSCIHRKKAECRNEALYPVQVYAILLSLAQFSAMCAISTTQLSRNGGFLFLLGMATSSIVRLICEHFRGDFRGFGFSSTQAFALMQLLAAFILPFLLSRFTEDAGSATLTGEKGGDLPYNILSENFLCFAFTFGSAFVAYGVHVVKPKAILSTDDVCHAVRTSTKMTESHRKSSRKSSLTGVYARVQ